MVINHELYKTEYMPKTFKITALEILLHLDQRVIDTFALEDRSEKFKQRIGNSKDELQESFDSQKNLGVLTEENQAKMGNALEMINDAYDEDDSFMPDQFLDKIEIAQEIREKWPDFPEEKIPEYYGTGNGTGSWEQFIYFLNSNCTECFECWDILKNDVAKL